MEPTPPDVPRAFRTALPVALGLPVLGIGLVCSLNHLSVSLVFTIVAVLAIVALIAVTRTSTPRAGIVGGIAVACWWLVGGLAAMIKVDVPLVWGPSSMHCGTAMVSFLLIAGPIAGFLSVAGGLGLGVVALRRRFDSPVRQLARVATVIALVVLAFQVPKLRLPEPDDYLASLEPSRAIAVNESIEIHGKTFHYARRPMPRVPATEALPAIPDYEQCDVLAAKDAATPEVTVATVQTSDPCPPMRFRTDPKVEVLIVETQIPGCAGDRCWSTATALRTSDWTTTDVTVRSAAHRLAAPTDWRIAGLFGVLVALVALALAAGLRKQASALGWIDAQHLGGGQVLVGSNAAPILVPVAASLPIGPIVLDGEKANLPTYREAGASSYARAFAGSLADHRALRTDQAASLTAVALAAAALGAAPLAAVRLLFGL